MPCHLVMPDVSAPLVEALAWSAEPLAQRLSFAGDPHVRCGYAVRDARSWVELAEGPSEVDRGGACRCRIQAE